MRIEVVPYVAKNEDKDIGLYDVPLKHWNAFLGFVSKHYRAYKAGCGNGCSNEEVVIRTEIFVTARPYDDSEGAYPNQRIEEDETLSEGFA